MNKSIHLALALALAIGASTAAQAGTGSASIKLTGLSIVAVDLRPNDNLGASYELLATTSPTKVTASVDGGVWNQQTAAGLFAPLSATSTGASGVTVSATIGATGLEARVDGIGAYAFLEVGEGVWDRFPQIRVAPWTALLIMGKYEVALSADCPQPNLSCEASAFLYMDFPGGDWNITFGQVSPYGESGRATGFYQNFLATSGSQAFSGSAGATYWNFSGHAQDLTFSLSSQAYVASLSSAAPIPAVPEPAVGALAAAGLSVAALAFARRRNQGR